MEQMMSKLIRYSWSP